jgi:hypothetical protein
VRLAAGPGVPYYPQTSVAGIRTFIGFIFLVCAAVIALISVSAHGYQEDFGSEPVNTLQWAIPWTVATGVLAVLVLGSAFDPTRRPQWSWLALGLALLMAMVLTALWIWT